MTSCEQENLNVCEAWILRAESPPQAITELSCILRNRNGSILERRVNELNGNIRNTVVLGRKSSRSTVRPPHSRLEVICISAEDIKPARRAPPRKLHVTADAILT